MTTNPADDFSGGTSYGPLPCPRCKVRSAYLEIPAEGGVLVRCRMCRARAQLDHPSFEAGRLIGHVDELAQLPVTSKGHSSLSVVDLLEVRPDMLN